MTFLSHANLFWVMAALSCVIALFFFLPGLMRSRNASGMGRREVNVAVYRDQLRELETEHALGRLDADELAAARRELEVRLANDALVEAPEAGTVVPIRAWRGLGYALALAFPLLAFGLYSQVGNLDALTAQGTPARPTHDFGTLLERVERKVEANPGDAEAWILLAKSYGIEQRWQEAARAYEKAVALLPGDAAVLSGYAETLVLGNRGQLNDEAMIWVRRALAADPDDAKGLELAGYGPMYEKAYAQAYAHFTRLYAQLPPELPYAQDILGVREEAGRLAGLTSGKDTAPVMADQMGGARISGRVDIAPALHAQIRAGDVLFVYARAAGGGPPLAAIRARASNLPMDFMLDDGAAVTPGNTLSAHERVNLGARISRSGGPIAGRGDLEGELRDVRVDAQGISLLIDRIHP